MNKLLLIIFIIGISVNTFGQKIELKGFVRDSLQNPLVGATILLKSKTAGYNYGVTDIKGNYNIKLRATIDTVLVEVRSLGFVTYKTRLTFHKQKNIKNITLYESRETLREIVIESKRRIQVDKDTITYNLTSFVDETEQTVEDVLNKLPGIDISEDGTIKFNGKSIEKILIEGDDLVSNNYTILSKNLDANLLKNVQVLRGYDDNPLRNKFKLSDKVALNLTIKDNKKNILFGVLKSGLGVSSIYNLKNNLGLLNKKTKFLNLNSANNNGHVTKSYFKPFIKNDFKVDINNNKELFIKNQVDKSFSTKVGFLTQQESALNESLETSFTITSKLSKKTSLRALTYFNRDQLSFYKSSLNTFNLLNEKIVVSEKRKGNDDLKNVFGNIEVKHFNDKNWYLTFESKWLKERNRWGEGLTVNNEAIEVANNSKNNNTYLFNHFRASYQPSLNFLWENYLYQTNSTSYQNYNVSQSRFDFNNGKPLLQNVAKKKYFLGWNNRITYKVNKNLFKVSLSVEKEVRKFDYKISDISGVEEILHQNKLDQRNLNFSSNFSYELLLKRNNKLGIEVGSFLKKIKEKGTDFDKLYELPFAKFNYGFDIKKLGRFSLSYSYKKDLLNYNSFFNGMYLKNYRTIVNSIKQLETSNVNSLGLSHSYQDLNSGFLMFTISSLSFFDKSLLSRTEVNQDFVKNNFEFLKKNSFLFFAQNETTQYFSSLLTSLKLKNNFTIYSNYLKVNNQSLEPLKSYSYSLRFSGTTYFRLPVNFQFFVKYKSDRNTFQGVTSNNNNYIYNLTANYKIHKLWNVKTILNSYHLNNNNQNFLSSEVFYKPKKSRFDYKLTMHNLFGENNFIFRQISDYQIYESESRIVPRYVLLTATMRF